MVTQLILTLLGFVALYFGYGLAGIGYAQVAGALISTVIIATTVNNRVCNIKFDLSISRALNFIKLSLPLAVTAILMTIYYRADFVMLSLMKDDQAVGYYNSAYTLVNGFLMVSTSFSAVILPRLTGYFKTDQPRMNDIYRISFKYLFYFGLAAAVGVTFVAKPLYDLIYPDSYFPGVIGFQILIWALALMFVNSIQSSYMIASDWKKPLMYIAGAGALINIILNFVLIPSYSYRGASIATLVTELITGVGFFVLIRNVLYPRQLANLLIRVIPSLVLMAAMLYLARDSGLFIQIVGGGIVFIVAIIITRGLNKQDMELLKRLIRSYGKTG
jgi:O-antigen/teichoic acid export membrane protein